MYLKESSEVDIVGSDVIRIDHLSRGSGVAYYIKKDYLIIVSQVFVLTLRAVLLTLFLSKSKPILVGVLYRQADKPKFISILILLRLYW